MNLSLGPTARHTTAVYLLAALMLAAALVAGATLGMSLNRHPASASLTPPTGLDRSVCTGFCTGGTLPEPASGGITTGLQPGTGTGTVGDTR